MNPFQAIMGMMSGNPSGVPSGTGQSGPMNVPASPVPSGPAGPAGMNPFFARVQQVASQFQNPQMLVDRFFPNAPAEVRNDPDQLVGWMQQSGMVTPQMIQMARSMMGGR